MSCSVCGGPLEASRADARYCSGHCQVAAYRAGSRVHGAGSDAKPYRGAHVDDREPSDALVTAGPEHRAIPEPTRESPAGRRGAVPDVVARDTPVYAAGSCHGPVYDAHGDRVPSPAPPVVGTLTADGRYVPLEGKRRAAAA